MNDMRNETPAASLHEVPSRLLDMQVQGRVQNKLSAREADLRLIAKAPDGFLDTTHFDTVRFPPPEWAHEVFARAAQDGEMAYSGYRGHPHVLRAVAENLASFLDAEIDPERQLILTPGTQAGLFGALSALTSPGDRVALGCPEYLFSERILRFLGADVAPVPLHTFGNESPSPDLRALEAEFRDKGVKLFVFSHPNNPTGAVYNRETLSTIARLAIHYDVTVVVDELYARLLHDGQLLVHLRNLPGMAERTVTLFGPSKTESLSGYRLGVVLAPEAVIKRMENMQSITALRAPAYAQNLLVHWLRDDTEWLAERMPAFTALRTMTQTKMTQLPWLKLSIGEGTAYAWPDINALGMPGDELSELLLTKAGILVSPGYQFGPGCDGFFRVCYARDETVWSNALDRMVTVLDEEAGKRGLARIDR
ncbi:MAG: Aspartate aminotransferase [Microvirga sp.]|jgi:aspartate/methionine/tyrosine aminotransferase|nr:Aspartate aminotransferase [Microvirga sp.]